MADATRAEVWRQIPGLSRYEASDLGRIRSRPTRQAGRVLRAVASGTTPYLQISTFEGGQRTSRTVHELVALAWIGPRPDGMQVRHLNGIHHDCRAANLDYGTPSQNIQDSVRHGTHWEARKTHCRQGHLYDRMNTRTDKAGKRKCRACERARRRARYARVGK